MTDMTQTARLTRAEIGRRLRKRDGDTCMYPPCGKTFEPGEEITVDHWMPVSWCTSRGWTYEQMWALENLRLMHKKCNAKKGDRVPNEDGTLPERTARKFRYRRDKRAQRPEVCTSCMSGRGLGPDEVCAACGSGPLPERFPRWAKVRANECDHELFWCWACSIGVVERAGAVEMILIHGEGGE